MGNQSCINQDTMHVSIPPTTETLRVKFPHVSCLCLGLFVGGLLPDNMPDDNPYKTLRHIRSMVITVIKALVHHRVHLRCAEKPLDAPVKSSSQDVHYYYRAVCRLWGVGWSWHLAVLINKAYSSNSGVDIYCITTKAARPMHQLVEDVPLKPLVGSFLWQKQKGIYLF